MRAFPARTRAYAITRAPTAMSDAPSAREENIDPPRRPGGHPAWGKAVRQAGREEEGDGFPRPAVTVTAHGPGVSSDTFNSPAEHMGKPGDVFRGEDPTQQRTVQASPLAQRAHRAPQSLLGSDQILASGPVARPRPLPGRERQGP